MPHLMNCPHSSAGWCLDCVKELWDEKELAVRNLSAELEGYKLLMRKMRGRAAAGENNG